MGTTRQAKYIQVIEYSINFCLLGLSVYFMYGVLDKFLSGKTSISQSEESINELPTIMACFVNPSLNADVLNSSWFYAKILVVIRILNSKKQNIRFIILCTFRFS